MGYPQQPIPTVDICLVIGYWLAPKYPVAAVRSDPNKAEVRRREVELTRITR